MGTMNNFAAHEPTRAERPHRRYYKTFGNIDPSWPHSTPRLGQTMRNPDVAPQQYMLLQRILHHATKEKNQKLSNTTTPKPCRSAATFLTHGACPVSELDAIDPAQTNCYAVVLQ